MTAPADAPSEAATTLRACLWMTGAIGSFSLMAVAGREVSFELDTFEIMMYRSIVGFVVVLAIARIAGTLGQVTTRSMGVHVARNVSHFAGQNLWFYAITLVPLAQVFSMEFTSPLWVIVLSPLVLGERLTPMRALAALMGFVGILIVARPSPSTFDPNVLFAGAAAIGFAGSAIFTRLLTRTETITCILFWMTGMQTVFGLVCAGADLSIAIPSGGSVLWLILIGMCGLTAHFCLTTALKLAPAAVVMPIDFARLPVIAMIGMLVYDEPLEFWVFLGAAVIFTGNYLNILSETRKVRIAR